MFYRALLPLRAMHGNQVSPASCPCQTCKMGVCVLKFQFSGGFLRTWSQIEKLKSVSQSLLVGLFVFLNIKEKNENGSAPSNVILQVHRAYLVKFFENYLALRAPRIWGSCVSSKISTSFSSDGLNKFRTAALSSCLQISFDIPGSFCLFICGKPRFLLLFACEELCSLALARLLYLCQVW